MIYSFNKSLKPRTKQTQNTRPIYQPKVNELITSVDKAKGFLKKTLNQKTTVNYSKKMLKTF
jgi:hypothetical protein